MVKDDDWSDQFSHSKGVSKLFADIEPFDSHYNGARTFFTVFLDEDEQDFPLFFPATSENQRIEEKEPNKPCQICKTISNDLYTVPYLSLDPHSGITEMDIYSADICESCLEKARTIRDQHKENIGPNELSKLI